MDAVKFSLTYTFAGLCDIGSRRETNQDRIILHPKQNFFAVSDGMGGLLNGEASAVYVSNSMPELTDICAGKCTEETTPEEAAEMMVSAVQMLSDMLYQKGNSAKRFDYGATLADTYGLDYEDTLVVEGGEVAAAE